MANRKDVAQQMLEHVARQRESGIAVAKYAKQFGISRPKLHYWIQKFNAPQARKDTSLKFIDLNSFGLQNSSESIGASEPVRTPQITLTLPNGICLKIY